MKIHIIPHAHLDPVWLWHWTAGLDEAIATCHTACDLMDRTPEMTFNLGDVWILQQVEQVDPDTFRRIRQFVEAGRWDLSGGWYIQPDCNFPRATSVAKQMQIGLTYLADRFGQRPRIAMNVDSFGHAATIPTLMNDAGQDAYIMMRPQEHEMNLPSRLFHWADPATRQQVMTFRIAHGYATPGAIEQKHLEASLTELPEGLQHTMCFIGVGDHGGGPTQDMLDWCRANPQPIDGVELVLSTPKRFFDAVREADAAIPTITGELQPHAVGCYSVEGRLKRLARQAEYALTSAERALQHDPHPPHSASQQLLEAWESVCFHEFHDTIGGTCIPSAYKYVSDDLGGASAVATRLLTQASRRRMLHELPPDPLQRIVLTNPTAQPIDTYLEFEPWCEFKHWQKHWTLLNPDGSRIPYQLLTSEASASLIERLLFRVQMNPDELLAIRIDRDGTVPAGEEVSSVLVTDSVITNDVGVSLHYSPNGPQAINLNDAHRPVAMPFLALIEDRTDTWSHGVDRYALKPQTQAVWSSLTVIDRGPLMASVIQEGRIGDSQLLAEWRVYAQRRAVELLLRVNWCERHKVLKLIWPLDQAPRRRVDGTMGGCIERPIDGREHPLQDWVLLQHDRAADRGVVCPDTFALDVQRDALRLTLLRSPALAHHDPDPGDDPRRRFADRGEHLLRFRFFLDTALDQQVLQADALAMHQPPLTADLTRGMRVAEGVPA